MRCMIVMKRFNFSGRGGEDIHEDEKEVRKTEGNGRKEDEKGEEKKEEEE